MRMTHTKSVFGGSVRQRSRGWRASRRQGNNFRVWGAKAHLSLHRPAVSNTLVEQSEAKWYVFSEWSNGVRKVSTPANDEETRAYK